jgi:hypothetical protein
MFSSYNSQCCTDALLTVQPSQVYLCRGCGDSPATDLLQATFTTSQGTSTTSSRQVTSAISTIPPLSASSTVAEESAASTSSSVSPPDQQNNVGAIVGGVVGGVALVCFVALALLFIQKRRRGNAQLPVSPEPKPELHHELSP